MRRPWASLVGLIVVTVLVPGLLVGCDAARETDTPPTTETPGSRSKPSVATAEAAVLAIAREEYSSIVIESAAVHAMGLDSQGNWWVQAWTTASPEFEGEPNEQWFVTWDGGSWELVAYGTGLDQVDFPQVLEWEGAP